MSFVICGTDVLIGFVAGCLVGGLATLIWIIQYSFKHDNKKDGKDNVRK